MTFGFLAAFAAVLGLAGDSHASAPQRHRNHLALLFQGAAADDAIRAGKTAAGR